MMETVPGTEDTVVSRAARVHALYLPQDVKYYLYIDDAQIYSLIEFKANVSNLCLSVSIWMFDWHLKHA